MRLSAPYFADILRESGERFDRVVCSTFVDVASFRSLAPAWVREVPVLTYFHENQFAYPVQVEDERDFHFALTNVTTAMASDSLAFNSLYNMRTFLEGCTSLLKHADDMDLSDPADAIRGKSRILPPGIDFSEIDGAQCAVAEGGPVVLWNHRWEHDKGPEEFFEALYALDEEGVDFRLVVLGQAFERMPLVFDEARQRLSGRIIHFGYAPSRGEYARFLRMGDVAVSTAQHEFFGIAMLEAVRAGCRPLLPRRLSYPELFGEEFIYGEGELKARLKESLEKGRLRSSEAEAMTARFSWHALERDYRDWLENLG